MLLPNAHAAAAEVLLSEDRTQLTSEAPFFTPFGFSEPGKPVRAAAQNSGKLRVIVRDAATGHPTPCRLNVIGPDGNFYQPPADDRLTPVSLTRRGNRARTGPYRYLGWFFYSTGDVTVNVPPGTVRVEIWKGLEHRPESLHTTVDAGATRQAEFVLERTASMADAGYYSGDMHFHLPRRNEADDDLILDLIEAEDVWYGALLASNHPPGAYPGVIEKLLGTRGAPQLRGLGRSSVRERGNYTIISGQEYRTGPYGHLNIYWRDDLVLAGLSYNANDWPVFGIVNRETQQKGGFAIYAHGGYKNEVYADVALGTVDAVELMQFGTYRGIGLIDWYNILNTGYRLPGLGASDFPLNRKMADCITYVHPRTTAMGLAGKPTIKEWLQAAVEGRSFFTSGPLLLLEVDGERPGAIVRRDGQKRLLAKVRVRSEVAPVTHVDLIVNGQTAVRFYVPAAQTQGQWVEFEHPLTLSASSWIAARAWSQARFGAIATGQDVYNDSAGEAHTNPVYCYMGGKAPYSQISLDAWVSRIEAQMASHSRRNFAEQPQVLAYYQRARDALTKIRAEGGLSAEADVRKRGGELPLPTSAKAASPPIFMPPGFEAGGKSR